jgi:hypothetical protein
VPPFKPKCKNFTSEELAMSNEKAIPNNSSHHY